MQDTTKHIILIPGLGGSGPAHWQTYCNSILPNASMVEQENWDTPVLQDWVDGIQKHIEGIQSKFKCETSQIIAIGHSMGCLALAEWIYQNIDSPLACVVMVAPADIHNTPEPVEQEDFDTIDHSELNCESVVITSDNDPWCTIEESLAFADDWNSELFVLENAGHISSSSGYGDWNVIDYLNTKGYGIL